MSVRNLDSMYKPKSIALIGASQKPGKIGTVVTHNLIRAGFQGDIYPVNPKYEEIEGLRVYPDVSSLPRPADLAVIATPPDTVPALIRQLGEKGTKAAVVITAGFGESEDAQGKARQDQMLLAAQPHLLRIVGPNCLGIMVPRMSLNASFGHIPPLTGRIAFVAQSGAVLTSVLDWATAKQIGFSYFVSLGDMADVDFADMLDYLASDPHTHAVLLYIEAIQHARKFMSAARALARIKPVVVIKVGRYVESARAVASHTGALAGSDAVYDAAFRRSGVLRVDSLSELFGVVETLALTRPFTGDRLAILTNGGGIGVLATDSLISHGGRLAELSRETIERLNEALPPTWSHGNPVDIIGDAPGSRYADALEALLRDPGVDAILTLNCPLAIASSLDAAKAVVRTAGKQRGTARTRGLLTSWLGETAAEPARRLFIEDRIPTYETPTEAVRAYMHMVEYRRRQEMLMETPASVPETFLTDLASVRAVVDQTLQDGRNWLSEQEVRAFLNAYGVPTTECWYAGTPDAAAALAAKLNRLLALKIDSPDITHKSDVGGVALNLDTPDAVRNAASSMLERIRGAAPTATVHGFSIQPMVRRPNAFELIVGMTVDQQFGPVLLFGHGGTAVEVIQDKTVALPPLNMHLAHEMMRHTRIYRLLEGYRDRPAVDLNAVAMTLVKISQLVCDIAAIVELDINPLLADQWGVVAVDARIRVAPLRCTAFSEARDPSLSKRTRRSARIARRQHAATAADSSGRRTGLSRAVWASPSGRCATEIHAGAQTASP